MTTKTRGFEQEADPSRDLDLQKTGQTAMGFGNIKLLKMQTIGIGAYGIVCKALCDDLLCAAKILHQTLFDPSALKRIASKREHRLPIKRFEQECEFMSAIKHPNIVQYLGTHKDPESGLPVLLMELMDGSLTDFLESSHCLLPYNMEVKFCHDIALAISFLHFNGITHRDLSSNNVLMCGNVKVKVTDFGMAKLNDLSPKRSSASFTMCPGTDAYMPPETTKSRPVYTAKIDCFAIGVLIIQMLTREFPTPTDRRISLQVDLPQVTSGRVEIKVSEIKRRESHISQIDPKHPLLPIALDCLKDKDAERPSAQELCQRVAALKDTLQSVKNTESDSEEMKPQQDIASEKDEEIVELQQQIQEKDKCDVIEAKNTALMELVQELKQEKCDVIKEKDGVIQQCKQIIREKNKQIKEKERQLQQLKAQYSTQGLEKQLSTDSSAEMQTESKTSFLDSGQMLFFDASKDAVGSSFKDSIKLWWYDAKKAPYKMCRRCDAIEENGMVYFRAAGPEHIYSYNSTHDTWNELPDCPAKHCSLAVVNGFLTSIGGNIEGKVTNQLSSLTGQGVKLSWKVSLKPMPTKRSETVTVSIKNALIAAGGVDQDNKILKTVEVLDIPSQEWSIAADLLVPLMCASTTICGDYIYMLGGWSKKITPTNSVYRCSLTDLLESCKAGSREELFDLSSSLTVSGQASSESTESVWGKISDLPVTRSTCTTLHGQLLAIGGDDSRYTPTADIRGYNASSDTWEIIDKMKVTRYRCFAVVLPGPTDQLMVMGGLTSRFGSVGTDALEMAIVV